MKYPGFRLKPVEMVNDGNKPTCRNRKGNHFAARHIHKHLGDRRANGGLAIATVTATSHHLVAEMLLGGRSIHLSGYNIENYPRNQDDWEYISPLFHNAYSILGRAARNPEGA